jgi:hypothetical protein
MPGTWQSVQVCHTYAATHLCAALCCSLLSRFNLDSMRAMHKRARSMHAARSNNQFRRMREFSLPSPANSRHGAGASSQHPFLRPCRTCSRYTA